MQTEIIKADLNNEFAKEKLRNLQSIPFEKLSEKQQRFVKDMYYLEKYTIEEILG